MDNAAGMTNRLSAKPLSPQTWPDFEALFGAYHGVRGGCWCTFYLCGSSQFDRMSREERKEYHRDLVMRGEADGMIICDAETPVAWCQFGRPEALKRYSRSKAYQRMEIAEADKPQWRISCLFTDKHCRGQGIAGFALQAALGEIAARGGGVTEAFPFDIPGAGHNQHTGSVDMYRREGFEIVAPFGKNAWMMRKNIPGLQHENKESE